MIALFLFQISFLLRSPPKLFAFRPVERMLPKNFQCTFTESNQPQLWSCSSPRRWTEVVVPRSSYLHSTSSTKRSRDPYCVEDQCYVPDDDSSADDFSLYSSTTTTIVNPNGAPFTTLMTSSFIDDGRKKMQSRGQFAPQGLIDGLLYVIPVVAPILAYCSYTNVQSAFVQFIDLLSNAKWVVVDGGLYQTQIITPAINGIVVPSVAVLFATLVTNTVTTLRQRQLSIRTSLNMEASELRILQSMVDSFPVDNDADHDDDDDDDEVPSISYYQDQCRRYLMHYAIRILAESQDTVNYSTLEYSGSIDSEMNALVSKLNELSRIEHQRGLSRMSPHLLSESYAAITRLNSERATRISALQSTFPALHYVILMLLAISILVTFLVETSQKANLFLNKVYLQMLWTILIGTFAALGVVLYDLTDPFTGSYQISGSRRQLFTIRDALRASAQMKINSKSKVGPSIKEKELI